MNIKILYLIIVVFLFLSLFNRSGFMRVYRKMNKLWSSIRPQDQFGIILAAGIVLLVVVIASTEFI